MYVCMYGQFILQFVKFGARRSSLVIAAFMALKMTAYVC